MNPLQALIRARMAEQHWSFADVARRGALPRSTVHHLATNEQPSRPPHPQTLLRLAAGLDLPAERVRVAAAESTAHTVLTLTKDPEIEFLLAAVGRLSQEDRRYVAALVRTLLARRDAGETDKIGV
ncbi:helix-turn-helix transcriptional regulator [Actinospica sp.]|uniref:helix-turn-helix transcriptional regulator n=1 Tax=Actinospica sp. TaxID=1872142 RepID=UPI002B793BBE|nr:helix-turn-helix transcriptional regulator [Actinospica sp.]HWG27651.1 helix-turn-helix transcriptional regulator [Actinospica sp.]